MGISRMLLKNYLNENFPNLELRKPLYYSWKNAIRFELGIEELRDYEADRLYLEEVYNRAITLFKSVHKSNDEIFVVANISYYGDGITSRHKLNVFLKYVKHKDILNKLNRTTIPYVYPEDDDEGVCKTHRFILKCKVSDIKYLSMIKAICNQDMGIKPSIHHEIYFINISKKTIFMIYDDRGCDILASSRESLYPVYKEYNEWILDYDRKEINSIFA
jgi:Domain of unknown function (DUF3885)